MDKTHILHFQDYLLLVLVWTIHSVIEKISSTLVIVSFHKSEFNGLIIILQVLTTIALLLAALHRYQKAKK